MSFDVFAIFFLLFCRTLWADDVMIITADRISSYTDKSSNDVKIITEETIKKASSHSLPELLSKESDLTVASSGPNGANSSLFLRGTDSSHTLVVIDGIVMNDPSNPNRQFDIGRLSLNNIEKIEILKGSQGLSYGSNAIGGVVVISTKKAKSDHISGESFFDYGTFNTINAGANFQKKIELLNISFGADVMKTDGFSAADKKFNPNAEADGDKRVTFDMGAGLDLSSAYTLDLKLRYVHNDADLDKGGGSGNDDPNDKQVEEELYSKIQLTKNWAAGNAETKFSYNRTTHFRHFEELSDPVHTKASSSVSKGELNVFSLNHTYYIDEHFTQNINLDWQHEKDQSQHFNQNESLFLYHQYETALSIFNFGLRLDHNKIFNDHMTYKAAAGYNIIGGLAKLSYSTGFRAPSINQLFDPTYGNHQLRPETSQSVELSFERQWMNHLKSNSVLFYTKIKDRLSYDPNTFINRNLGIAEISGFEQELNIDWSKDFHQSLAATLLKTRDLTLGQKLARRPDVNLKNTLSYQLKERHHFDYEISYVGKRLDVDNAGNTVKLDEYFISSLNYRYVMNDKNEFYLKIKNIFDKDFEEIYGFATGGRAITLGAHYNF